MLPNLQMQNVNAHAVHVSGLQMVIRNKSYIALKHPTNQQLINLLMIVLANVLIRMFALVI